MTADTMDALSYGLWQVGPAPIPSVPELHAGLVSSTEAANRVWAEWVARGRPVEHPYPGLRDHPAGWWGVARRAELYALALEAARWQVACRSWRWQTGQLAPNPRAVVAVRASSAVTSWRP